MTLSIYRHTYINFGNTTLLQFHSVKHKVNIHLNFSIYIFSFLAQRNCRLECYSKHIYVYTYIPSRSLLAQWLKLQASQGQTVLSMTRMSWVRIPVGSNLGSIVLPSKTDLNQKYMYKFYLPTLIKLLYL